MKKVISKLIHNRLFYVVGALFLALTALVFTPMRSAKARTIAIEGEVLTTKFSFAVPFVADDVGISGIHLPLTVSSSLTTCYDRNFSAIKLTFTSDNFNDEYIAPNYNGGTLTADLNLAIDRYYDYDGDNVDDLCAYMLLTYDVDTDKFDLAVYLNTKYSRFYDACFDGESQSSQVSSLRSDVTDVSNALHAQINYIRIDSPSYEYAKIKYHVKNGEEWLDFYQQVQVGSLPYPGSVLPSLGKYHDVAFAGWSPAITTVTSADSKTYTAIYIDPFLRYTDETGEEQIFNFEYGYLDETVLFDSFGSSIEDIGTEDVTIESYVPFENRKDWWFTQVSTSSVPHDIDTNLTLEAISYKIREKGTNHMYDLFDMNKLLALPGTDLSAYMALNQDMINYILGDFSEFATVMSICLSPFNDDPRLIARVNDWKDKFLYTYYFDKYIEQPDEYELVYVYYYSSDLPSQSQATFTYTEFNQSTLAVKVTSTDKTLAKLLPKTSYLIDSSYTLEDGCYFVLNMQRLWNVHCGLVTGNQYKNNDLFEDTFAGVYNARFRVLDWTGEVVYDQATAEDLNTALESKVYLYTNSFDETKPENYTVTIEFYDSEQIKAKEKTPGSSVKETLDNIAEGTATAWEYVKIALIVIGSILGLALIVWVIRFIFNR